MMKSSMIPLFFFVLATRAAASGLPYQDPNTPVEARIDDLLPRMTLEEKIFQLNQWSYGRNTNPNNIEEKVMEIRPEIGSLLYSSSNPAYRNKAQRRAMEESRLGIPILFGFDVIHGYRTIFPIPLAQACSWNPVLVEESCRIAAKEAWLSGVDWTFSPMIDVARDPRWGRVAEGYGEDPVANAVFGAAAVQGYQGDSLADRFTIAACLKHYTGYSLSEGGREYRYTDVSGQTLWETFMPPYEAGVKAGAATVMSGFNDITGVPATANHYTLTEILKQQWQFDGFVISDWSSIRNLIHQGVAADRKEAGFKAFTAGVDMDMIDNIYNEHLAELVREQRIPLQAIDDAVRRILRIKFRLGLFDRPYVDELDEGIRYLQPGDLAVAGRLAAESMVLLKNEDQLLPLGPGIKRLAVIGPMVQDSLNLMGSWRGMGRAGDVETLWEGLQAEFKSKAVLQYAPGCDFEGTDTTGFAQALEIARSSDAVVLCLGEKGRWSGENSSRSSIALPAVQERLAGALQKTGKPVVLVLSSGRPLELIRLEKTADAILEIWQPGTAGGSALAGILSGRINPSGRLSITFPQTTGQIPMHYNQRKQAVIGLGHYQDIPEPPLYPFGHGLSYTEFSHGEIQLSAARIRKDENIVAEIEVSNDGSVDGKETLLWFIADPFASISRPVRELKFFEKKEIRAGEKTLFRFEIDPMRDLSYPDGQGNRHLEAGEFFIQTAGQQVRFELID